MDQARFLQRVRMNQFKKVYDRWKQKKLTQKEAGEQLGITQVTLGPVARELIKLDFNFSA